MVAMVTNRVSAAVAAVAVIALAVAASVAAAPKATPTVTLRYIQTNTGQAATEILVANFERVYPNINIDVLYLPTAQLQTLLLTQFQSGTAPDLFYVQGGRISPTAVWPLAEAGRLLDLSGRKWDKRIYPPARDGVSWKGKVYAWPLVVQPYDILVNTDLFKQLGLKAPTRASDVLALCRKITAAGKIPFAQGFGDVAEGNIVGRVMEAAYVYNVDPKWNDKRAGKQATFASSPLWRRALQALVDMKDAGCFQAGAQATSRPQQYTLFANGSAVMSIIAASELPGILAANPKVKYAMINLPPDNPKQAAVFTIANIAVAANAATQHPAEVKTLVDFLAREQQSTLFSKVAGTLAPLDVKKGLLPDYMKAGLGPLFKAGKLVSNLDAEWPNPLVFSQGYATGIIGLFTGQRTVDTVLADMDRLWDTTT